MDIVAAGSLTLTHILAYSEYLITLFIKAVAYGFLFVCLGYPSCSLLVFSFVEEREGIQRDEKMMSLLSPPCF